jgi:hypothetical protein
MSHYLLIILKPIIPIGMTSFVLVWWALRQNYLGGAASLDEYERWKKAENRSRKEEKKRRKEAKRNGLSEDPVDAKFEDKSAKKKFDPLHSKWMEFGGGFYGVVAFFTYLLVELGEVRDLLLHFSDLFRGGLISMVVQFFIESIKNFITAIAWPAYWLRRIPGDPWLWVIGAYAGYWLGTRAGFHFGPKHTNIL